MNTQSPDPPANNGNGTNPPTQPDQSIIQDKVKNPHHFFRLICALILSAIVIIPLILKLTPFVSWEILGVIDGIGITSFAAIFGIFAYFFGIDTLDEWLYDKWIQLCLKGRPLRFITIPLLVYRRDFYIFYHTKDNDWLEWIAWQLRADGYQVISYNWNGEDYQKRMLNARLQARKTLVLWSPDFFNLLRAIRVTDARRKRYAGPTKGEWLRDFLKQNEKGKIVPIKVRDCELELSGDVDLLIDEKGAEERLFAELDHKRGAKYNENNGPDKPLFPLNSVCNIPEVLYSKPFTGRETFLEELYILLGTDEPAGYAPVAIVGMNGLGKTLTAVAYAKKYKAHYHQTILWVDASSEETLKKSFEDILLLIGGTTSSSSTDVGETIKLWLSNRGTPWLLIFDGCRDLQLVQRYIPGGRKGHVLLTTPISITESIARPKPLGLMEEDEAILFLLRQSRNLKQHQTLRDIRRKEYRDSLEKNARNICSTLGWLPMAIEQTGAYLYENKRPLADFPQLYRDEKDRLFRFEPLSSKHVTTQVAQKIAILPKQENVATIATIWSLSFDALYNKDEASKDNRSAWLLVLYTLLSSPDLETVPEEIIKLALSDDPGNSAKHLTETEFDKILQPALNLSLINREQLNQEQGKVLKVQPLMREVIHMGLGLSKVSSTEWEELAEKAVQAMSLLFPMIDSTNWENCQKYLPYAKICVQSIEEKRSKDRTVTLDEARLCYLIGYYLMEIGSYDESQVYLAKAIEKRHNLPDGAFPNKATCNLAEADLFHQQGNYQRAEDFYQKAAKYLDDYEKARDVPAQTTALPPVSKVAVLNGLGWLYEDWGKPEKADEQFEAAYNIYHELSLLKEYKFEKEQEIEYAVCKCNKAGMLLRKANGKQDKAAREELYKAAKELYDDVERIFTKGDLSLPEGHPLKCHYWTGLAAYYVLQGSKYYKIVIGYYEQDIDFTKKLKLQAHHHFHMVIWLNNLAEMYWIMHDNERAEKYYEDMYQIYRKQYEQKGLMYHEWSITVLDNYINFLEYVKRKKSLTEVKVYRAKIVKQDVQQKKA